MSTLYSRELPPMMRVSEMAGYLNICMRVAYKLVKQPGFPLVKLSSKGWRVNRDAFLEWLEEEPGTKELIEARKHREM